MASVLFDIRELYGKVWGGLVFPELLRRNNSARDYIFGTDSDADLATPAPQLGRPIQSELTLELGSERLKFTIPPIITVQGSLNIVETVVAGLDGAIKEITSVNDYVLSIRGFLSSTSYTDISSEGYSYRLNPDEFPEGELRQLRRFCESKQSLKVLESRLLSYFNIKKVLIRTWGFPELEGYTFMIPFELDVVSDTDFVLELTQEDV